MIKRGQISPKMLLKAFRRCKNVQYLGPDAISKDTAEFPVSWALSKIEDRTEDMRFREKVESLSHNPQNGLEYDAQASLRPVDPRKISKDVGEKKCLIHKGLLVPPSGHPNRDCSNTNYENLITLGVFGCPKQTRATYMARPDVKIQTYDRDAATADLEIELKIDVDELLKSRGVYIDPESVYCTSDIGEEHVGDSFVVFGGIPGKAVRSFRYQGIKYKVR